MSTPVMLLNSSQYMCGALPTPADATVILPGLRLASAISSGTDLAGSDGLTTSTPGPREIVATGAKSRMTLNLRLS